MIDWQRAIKNLQETGIGVTQAASMAQVPSLHLVDIVRGRAIEPPFSTGLKLLDLHLDACPGKHIKLIEED